MCRKDSLLLISFTRRYTKEMVLVLTFTKEKKICCLEKETIKLVRLFVCLWSVDTAFNI